MEINDVTTLASYNWVGLPRYLYLMGRELAPIFEDVARQKKTTTVASKVRMHQLAKQIKHIPSFNDIVSYPGQSDIK